jgi:hypothetical protein
MIADDGNGITLTANCTLYSFATALILNVAECSLYSVTVVGL